VRAVHAEAAADRVAPGPESPGHGVADEDHGRRLRPVDAADVAPAQEPRAYGAEQVGGAGLQREVAEAAHRVDPVHEQPLRPGIPEGHRQSPRRPGHAGDAPGLGFEPPHQLRALLVGQLHAAVFRADIEDVLEVVSESQRAHVLQAAHEEPRGDEQYDRQRSLEDEQHRARA
jgi:hypothetical protein